MKKYLITIALLLTACAAPQRHVDTSVCREEPAAIELARIESEREQRQLHETHMQAIEAFKKRWISLEDFEKVEAAHWEAIAVLSAVSDARFNQAMRPCEMALAAARAR